MAIMAYPLLCVSFSSLTHRPLRYAVLGAGFAGLSVAWHLLKHHSSFISAFFELSEGNFNRLKASLQRSSEGVALHVDIYDEIGIGGGASGVSGGLLHPYSPKGKPLPWGVECWNECLKLLTIAEAAVRSNELDWDTKDDGQVVCSSIVRRRGILRPALSTKSLVSLRDNAQNCIPSCRVETIDQKACRDLVCNLQLPLDMAFYMPEAVNIHPQRYLEALYLACQNLVKELPNSSIRLHKESVHKLLDLEGDYDAVIVCLGAKADMLPELAGRLPLRMCRGVVAHLQLPDHICDVFLDSAPSILSDAWLAVRGPRSLHMGSTWEWGSRNSSPDVSEDESFKTLEELVPKVSVFYPAIKDWTFAGARAGLRAMPPLTSGGSPPLLGRLNDIVGRRGDCHYWLFGGLGSRGLLYHGWLGKLTAQAVVSGDEQLLPPEFTYWKEKKE